LGAIAPDDVRATQVNAIEKEVLSSSAIEGEVLDRASVRSSILRQLGMDTSLQVRDKRSVG